MSTMIKAIYAKNKLRNYQYLLMSEQNVCIDPFNGEQMVDSLKTGQKIDILLNTHQHFDHIRGNQQVLDSGARLLGRDIDEVRLSQQDYLKRIHTPGHTNDSDSLLFYRNGDLEAIFGGDTLFVGGVGNCYNGGDALTLARTLIELDTILNQDTTIYPGHDYWESNSQFALDNFSEYRELKDAINKRDKTRVETSWGEEKGYNPFLRVLFDNSFKQKFFPDINRVEAFCKIRKMRDNF